MLGWRLGISAVLIPALVGLFVVDHKLGASAPVLLGLCLLLALRSTWELSLLLRTRSIEPNFAIVAICTLAVVASAWVEGPWAQPEPVAGRVDFRAVGPVGLTYTVSVLALLIFEAVRYREPGTRMEALGAELLIVSYAGVLLAVAVQLRWVPGTDSSGIPTVGSAGYLALGSLVIAAKCGDIGAYTLGRMFGKRKMAPYLSPNKTWMGALGAVLGSGLGALLWLQLATPRLIHNAEPCAWYVALGYGVIVGIAGLFGDLCESLIKRDVGRKDSAPLLPGFGGLLDLLDSILYAGPVAYLLWQFLPLATWQ